jgi:hypothetical protein
MFPDAALALSDAGVLTPYGVSIRYPGDHPEPNLEKARQAMALARKVRDAILLLMPNVPHDGASESPR